MTVWDVYLEWVAHKWPSNGLPATGLVDKVVVSAIASVIVNSCTLLSIWSNPMTIIWSNPMMIIWSNPIMMTVRWDLNAFRLTRACSLDPRLLHVSMSICQHVIMSACHHVTISTCHHVNMSATKSDKYIDGTCLSRARYWGRGYGATSHAG